ncbi:hypothetical protein DYB37_006467, partial [Aphanomyces astaci]
RETSTLEDIHGALVAERSKKAYASGIRQVVKWIQQTNQADALLSADGSINLAAFSYDDFVRFIVWTMQNTAVKASTMSGYRSAMRNYYKMQKVPLPSQFDGDIKDVFQGLKLALIEDNPVGSSEIGTHSIRKGAATFVSSGSTGGPSLVSICLRCGWSLGSVFERYMHYERAGDQFVGRVVAGLPLNQANFAVLPPHFVDNNSDAVVAALDVTFPTLSKVASMRGILAHGMASLVRHFDYVVDTLPAKHIVFGTPIFRQPLMLEALKAELATTNQRLQPSGIPPYIEVYRLLEHQGSSIDAMPRSIVDQMRGMLEERDVTHGTITSVLIKQTIVDALQVLGVGRHLDEPALRREDEQGQRVTFRGILEPRAVVMANSRFEYVRNFELPDQVLLNTWIVVRVDGRGFHKYVRYAHQHHRGIYRHTWYSSPHRFTDTHGYAKPNDARGLHLMNRAVMQEFGDIFLAYGQSDEYSLVFTNMRDYLSWRHVDCHINNLYNTCFWSLVHTGESSPQDAEALLRHTDAKAKHELLFSQFQVNYNDISPMFKRGSTLFRTPDKSIAIAHVDLIKDETFWITHIPLLTPRQDDH